VSQVLGGLVAGKRARHEALDRIELANERADLGAGDGPLLDDLVEFAFRVGPAVRKDETRTVAGQRRIDGKAVDDGRAAVAGQHLAAFLGRLPGEDAIRRDGRTADTPDRASRRLRRAQNRPPRFIDVDDGRLERAPQQRPVGRLQMARQRVQLIPERLRIEVQPLAGHHPHLPFERQMGGVLGDRHADREFRRVAAAGDQRQRRRRRHDRAIAGAAILLPDVVLDLIGELHGRDALSGFGLAGHLLQFAPARRTLALVGRELMADLDRRQRGLWSRTVAGLREALPAGGRRLRPREDLRAGLLQFLDERERELLGVWHTAQARELRGQLADFVDEAMVFAIEEEADLSQRVKIAFLIERQHRGRI
jgi:hypothetical protein